MHDLLECLTMGDQERCEADPTNGREANGYLRNLQNDVFVNNGGDNRKSCRLRWFNQLDPQINKRAFSEEEEEKFLRAHRVYGNKWAMIARLFPGRTDNAMKNHWHVVDARKQRENASSINNVYKRRMPFSRAEIVSTQHTSIIAYSHKSTITSAKDESNSTCTDLSLNSFSNKAQPELQLDITLSFLLQFSFCWKILITLEIIAEITPQTIDIPQRMDGVQLYTIVHFGGDIGYPEANGKGLDPRRFGPLVDDDDVLQSNESFETLHTDVPPSNEPTIPTNVPLSNEPCIPQSNIHLSNEPMLTIVPLSNEPMLTNVSLSIEPKTIIGQTEPSAKFQFEPQPKQVKDLVDFRFKSITYTKDPYGFSKEFNIGDQYRDMIEHKNHIRAYAVENKFNLEHVLSNEYKIMVRCKGHKCSWQIYATWLTGSALFRVSTYCSMHTCIRVETDGRNAYKVASSRWVASIIKKKLLRYPNYKPSEIIDDMKINHNIDVTYNLAWRAKEKAHAENSFEREISWDSTNSNRH
ncbi:hypothetical protein GIB67_000121 [Kingdonia uniflora]|uniref:Uncharacterized protein n=1 Tax=Kingdonia uniflora TaxID=39325 RepID=A0A7J7M5U7_9MAGN|nr:hypothetical protein GIB67_000121 [Kingdonia uniflora]